MVRKVLWTGGWDSTYRVLDLVINKKRKVLPFYIIDESRHSTEMELDTMDKIANMIKQFDVKAFERLLDLVIIEKKDIPKNSELTASYKRLAQISHLGNQYDWLARYAEANNIYDLELCTHVDDTVEGFIRNDVKLIKETNDKYYKLNEHLSNPDLKIFSYFHYPLYDMSKLQMEEKSRSSGFSHIMEQTWFCHSPIGNKPCGMCNPCKYTREEGLGRRVPTPNIFIKLNRKVTSKWNGLKRKFKR